MSELPVYEQFTMTTWNAVMDRLAVQNTFDIVHINTPPKLLEAEPNDRLRFATTLLHMTATNASILMWSDGKGVADVIESMKAAGLKYDSVAAIINYSPKTTDAKKKSRTVHTPTYFRVNECNNRTFNDTCEYLLLFTKNAGCEVLNPTKNVVFNYPQGLRQNMLKIMQPTSFKSLVSDDEGWFATRPSDVVDSVLSVFQSTHKARSSKTESAGPTILDIFGTSVHPNAAALGPLIPCLFAGPLNGWKNDAIRQSVHPLDVVEFCKTLVHGLSKTKLQGLRSKLLQGKEQSWADLAWGDESGTMLFFKTIGGHQLVNKSAFDAGVLHVLQAVIAHLMKASTSHRKRTTRRPKIPSTVGVDSALLQMLKPGAEGDITLERADAVNLLYDTLKEQGLVFTEDGEEVERVRVTPELLQLIPEIVQDGYDGTHVSVLKLEFLVLRKYFPTTHKRRGIDCPSSVGEPILTYMGFGMDQHMARTEVVWLLNRHLKRISPPPEAAGGKMQIVLTDTMCAVLNTTDKNTDYFKLSALLNQFFTSPTATKEKKEPSKGKKRVRAEAAEETAATDGIDVEAVEAKEDGEM